LEIIGSFFSQVKRRLTLKQKPHTLIKYRKEIKRMYRIPIVIIILSFLKVPSSEATVMGGAEENFVLRDSAKIWFSVGKDYARKKQYADALKNFRRALSYDSTFVDIYLNMAMIFLEMREFDSAESAYQKIVKVAPKDSRGWQGLGFMYGIIKNDIEKGIEFYKRALETDPENNDARFGLAKLLDKAGRSEEADRIYKDALEKDPENPGILKSYGLFLFDLRRYEEAVDYLEKALPHFEDDVDLRTALAESYRNLCEKNMTYLPKALDCINYLIKQDSTDVTLWVKRASILESMKRYKEALSDYDKAIELRGDYIVPYLKKASLLIDRYKKYSKAREVLRKALTLEFPTPDLKAAAIDLLGDTFFHEAEAMRKSADSLRKAGFESDAREKYSNAVNLYDRALAEYKKAIPIGGTWADYANKQIKRGEKLRKKTWRQSQGIE